MNTVWVLTNGDEEPRAFITRSLARNAARMAAKLRCKRASERLKLHCTVETNDCEGEFDVLWWRVFAPDETMVDTPTVMVWKLPIQGSAIDALADLAE